MKAGRELDALVAEHVMGMSHDEMWGINDYRADGTPVLVPDFPCYSDDPEAAWDVVKQMFGEWSISIELNRPGAHGIVVSFWHPDENKRASRDCDLETLPITICLCALEAKGSKR